MSFVKRGVEARKELEKEAARREASSNFVSRFWMPNESEAKITFLDGALTQDGTLDTASWYEHQVFMNGRWTNFFACVSEKEPCPICEGGDRPSLVLAFTIIDHREYKDKQGNLHKDQVRAFVCKSPTYKNLQKIALKRGGLEGCTFDVYRTGEKSASVGTLFDFVEKSPVGKIKAQYKAEVLDYETVVTVMDGSGLRQLGFGGLMVGGGGSNNTHTAPFDFGEVL